MNNELKPGARVQKVGTKRRGTIEEIRQDSILVWWDNETQSREVAERLTVLDPTPGRKPKK